MDVLEMNQSNTGSQETLEEIISSICKRHTREWDWIKGQALDNHAGFAICWLFLERNYQKF